jgi:PAS domain S-box-containing protein
MDDQISGANGASSRLGKGFDGIWQRLTSASTLIHDPDSRHQAQLLAAFHIMLISATFLLGIIGNWVSPLQTDSTFLLLLAITFIILLVTYGFSRTAHYKFAAVVALTTLCVFLFIAAILRLLPPGIGLLYYLIFPLLVLSLFFSMRATILFATLNLIAMLLLPLYRGEDVVPTLVYGPALFLIFGLFLTYQVKQQRDWLEKDRQNQLAAQEQQLRLITDNMRDIVTHLGADSVIRYMSPSLKTILGYPHENSIGQPISRWFERLHPDDVEHVRADLVTMLSSKYPYSSRFRIHHADGHYVWLEAVGNPLYRSDQRADGVILVTRDVSERQLVEQALQASETKFRAVAETIDASIMLVRGEEAVYINAGAEKITGYTRDELRTMNLLDLMHPDERDRLRERFLARGRGENVPTQYEVRLINKKGETRWNLVSVTVMEYEGYPTILSTAIDITHSKRAEEQQMELALERQKVRLLRRFLGDFSHDLRNPLATIGTSLYLLRKSDTPEKRERHIDVIAQQASHLEKVVQDLLTIIRLENADDAFDFMPLDINDLLHSLVKDKQAAADEKNLNLELTPAPGGQSIIGDFSQLHSAIGHLLSNAIAYTPEKGSIKVRAVIAGNGLQIDMCDTGIGIAPDDLPHIFDHFYRADKARNTSTGGLGLGLTIAKRIIEAHDGKLTVESELGAGCTFHIYLPIRETLEISHNYQGS